MIAERVNFAPTEGALLSGIRTSLRTYPKLFLTLTAAGSAITAAVITLSGTSAGQLASGQPAANYSVAIGPVTVPAAVDHAQFTVQVEPNRVELEEFNRWAEDGRGAELEQEHLPIVLPVLDRMGIEPDDNVLDLGCGAGWLTRLLSGQLPEGRVVGVDVSDEMIRRARRRYADLDNAMFVVGAAEEIPWDANFFTRAISVESAYYWPDPARGLQEIFRVMREGGCRRAPGDARNFVD